MIAGACCVEEFVALICVVKLLSESLIHERAEVKCSRGELNVKEEEEPRCGRCGEFIDDCKCACPYCGETSGCECCTGYGRATGG